MLSVTCPSKNKEKPPPSGSLQFIGRNMKVRCRHKRLYTLDWNTRESWVHIRFHFRRIQRGSWSQLVWGILTIQKNVHIFFGLLKIIECDKHLDLFFRIVEFTWHIRNGGTQIHLAKRTLKIAKLYSMHNWDIYCIPSALQNELLKKMSLCVLY